MVLLSSDSFTLRAILRNFSKPLEGLDNHSDFSFFLLLRFSHCEMAERMRSI